MNLAKYLESSQPDPNKTLILRRTLGEKMPKASLQTYVEVRIMDSIINDKTFLIKLDVLSQSSFYQIGNPVWIDYIECSLWDVINYK